MNIGHREKQLDDGKFKRCVKDRVYTSTGRLYTELVQSAFNSSGCQHFSSSRKLTLIFASVSLSGIKQNLKTTKQTLV